MPVSVELLGTRGFAAFFDSPERRTDFLGPFVLHANRCADGSVGGKIRITPVQSSETWADGDMFVPPRFLRLDWQYDARAGYPDGPALPHWGECRDARTVERVVRPMIVADPTWRDSIFMYPATRADVTFLTGVSAQPHATYLIGDEGAWIGLPEDVPALVVLDWYDETVVRGVFDELAMSYEIASDSRRFDAELAERFKLVELRMLELWEILRQIP